MVFDYINAWGRSVYNAKERAFEKMSSIIAIFRAKQRDCSITGSTAINSFKWQSNSKNIQFLQISFNFLAVGYLRYWIPPYIHLSHSLFIIPSLAFDYGVLLNEPQIISTIFGFISFSVWFQSIQTRRIWWLSWLCSTWIRYVIRIRFGQVNWKLNIIFFWVALDYHGIGYNRALSPLGGYAAQPAVVAAPSYGMSNWICRVSDSNFLLFSHRMNLFGVCLYAVMPMASYGYKQTGNISHCKEATKPKHNIDCIMIVNFCMHLKGLSYGGVAKSVSTAYPSYGMYFAWCQQYFGKYHILTRKK